MLVERSVKAVVEWSLWRRWHQAWARYYHYRRRESAGAEQPAPTATPAAVQQVDVLEEVWRRLEPLLPPAHRVGHPYEHSRRLVLEAIVYVMQTDCGWEHLPSQYPPWQTVYTQLAQWRKNGIWDKIWAGIGQPSRTDQLQL